MQNSNKSKHLKRIKIIFGTGCDATLLNKKFVSKLKTRDIKTSNWATKGGNFKTSRKADIQFIMPEFHRHKEVRWTVYVDQSSSESRYDMIIGRYLMSELGFKIDFQTGRMEWDNASIPMESVDKLDSKYVDHFEQEQLFIHDPISTDAERIQSLIDKKYSKQDLDQICDAFKRLSTPDKKRLHNLLMKYENLFDGTLGTWKIDPVQLK